MRTLKKTLCLVLALVMMLGVCAFSTSAAFSDAEKITNKEAVDVLTGIGVIKGMGDAANTFNPDGTLTRAQACTIIAKLMGGDGITAKSTFTDMADAAWAESYVAFCQAKGVVGGYGDGKFGPNDTLTGSQWAKMVLTAAGVDAKDNGFEAGNINWEIGVAKTVKDKGLAARISGFNGTQSISRDAACELGFQGMKISPKGSTGYVVGGMTFPDLASAVLYNSSLEAGERGITAAPAADSLMASNFPGLKPIQAKKDAFGRTLTGWTYNAKNTGKASDDVVVYETTKAAAYTLTVNALNKAGLNSDFVAALNKAKSTKLVAADSVNYVVNGATAVTSYASFEISDEIEVNLTDGKVSDVYVIRYELAKIGKTTAVTGAAADALTGGAIGSTSYTMVGSNKVYSKQFANNTFAENDYALVAYAPKDGANFVIADAKAVKTVEGTVAKKSGTTLTIGGQAYAATDIDGTVIADAIEDISTIDFKNTYVLYLAQDGTYLAAVKKTDKVDTSVAFAVAAYEKQVATPATEYGSRTVDMYYVQCVNLDGDIVNYQVKKATYDAFAAGLKTVKPAPAKHEDMESLGVQNYVELEAVAADAAVAAGNKVLGAIKNVTAGTAMTGLETSVEGTVSGNKYYTTSGQKVIFLGDISNEAQTLNGLKVTVKTGKTAIKDTMAYIIYGTRSAATTGNYNIQAIFVTAKPVTESTGTGLIFANEAADSTATEPAKDGSIAYVHNVWIDGEVATIKTASDDAIVGVYKYSIDETTGNYVIDMTAVGGSGADKNAAKDAYLDITVGRISNNNKVYIDVDKTADAEGKTTTGAVADIAIANVKLVNTLSPIFDADNYGKCASSVEGLTTEQVTIIFSTTGLVKTPTVIYITGAPTATEAE